MRDCNAPACVSLADITLLVIRIGYEDVPLVIDHVCVQVVRATGMIGIIP